MTKKKLIGIQVLREIERKRRLVPEVVIRRRIALAAQKDDPALAVVNKARNLSKKHAATMRNLIIRGMGLLETEDTVKRNFQRDGMDDVSLDSDAKALLRNSIRKVTEILIFKLVATELVNDPALRDTMVNLFLDQRFAAMVPRTPATPPEPEPSRRLSSPDASRREAILEQALSIAMGLE